MHCVCCIFIGFCVVYSTCSNEPEENEEVVSWLLAEHPDASLEEIDLPLVRSPAIKSFNGKEYHPDIDRCVRIWPQDNHTEGFFIARIRKS